MASCNVFSINMPSYSLSPKTVFPLFFRNFLPGPGCKLHSENVILYFNRKHFPFFAKHLSFFLISLTLVLLFSIIDILFIILNNLRTVFVDND